MARIFVSYKRQDKDIVYPIVEEIKQNTGIDCWIDLEGIESGDQCKQSFRAVLCTLIYISTFVPNLNFGQDEHKRRRQVLCLNGSQVPNRVQEQEPSRVL